MSRRKEWELEKQKKPHGLGEQFLGDVRKLAGKDNVKSRGTGG